MRQNVWLTPGGANLVFLALVVILLTSSMVLGPLWGIGINALVNQMIILGIPLALALFYRWPLGSLFRFHRVGIGALAGGFCAGVAIWWANASIYVSMQRLLDRVLGPLPGNGSGLGPLDGLWLLVAIVVLAPIIEEIFFRGYMLRAYESRRPQHAWLWVGLLFGVLHLGNGIVDFFGASLMGFVFGYIAQKSTSLWPAVAAHLGVNLTAVVAGSVLQTAAAGGQYPYWLLLISAVAAVFVLTIVMYFKRSFAPPVTAQAPLGQGLDRPIWRVLTVALAILILMVPVATEVAMRLGYLNLPRELIDAGYSSIQAGKIDGGLELGAFHVSEDMLAQGALNLSLRYAFSSDQIEAIFVVQTDGREVLAEPWAGIELTMDGSRVVAIDSPGMWQLMLIGRADNLEIEVNWELRRDDGIFGQNW